MNNVTLVELTTNPEEDDHPDLKCHDKADASPSLLAIRNDLESRLENWQSCIRGNTPIGCDCGAEDVLNGSNPGCL